MTEKHLKETKTILYVWLMIFILILSSCATYSHEKINTAITAYPDGRTETVTEKCNTSICSMREVKAGDIRVSTKCALTGGAESLGANEKLIDLMTQIIKKAP